VVRWEGESQTPKPRRGMAFPDLRGRVDWRVSEEAIFLSIGGCVRGRCRFRTREQYRYFVMQHPAYSCHLTSCMYEHSIHLNCLRLCWIYLNPAVMRCDEMCLQTIQVLVGVLKTTRSWSTAHVPLRDRFDDLLASTYIGWATGISECLVSNIFKHQISGQRPHHIVSSPSVR
jgi:hypothetical protein